MTKGEQMGKAARWVLVILTSHRACRVGCNLMSHVSACWLTGLGFRHTYWVPGKTYWLEDLYIIIVVIVIVVVTAATTTTTTITIIEPVRGAPQYT